MSKIQLCLTIVLTLTVSACSSRYGKPSAEVPERLGWDAERSGDQLVVDGLVEFGDSVPFRHRPKGDGKLTISPETIAWINLDDDERSFSIRQDAVKSVTMKCVVRAGGNICLEMAIDTITDLTYEFRDVEWAGGYNERILRARDRMKQNFPSIVFAEKVVDEID